MPNNIQETLQLIEEIVAHDNSKGYWMVRTDDGRNYSTFVENNFVALNVLDLPTAFLHRIVEEYQSVSSRISQIREHILQLHNNGTINLTNRNGDVEASSVSRLAKQIYSLCFGMKCGDIVIIPDKGANRLCIGRIADEQLAVDRNLNGHFTLVRQVEWIKEIRKSRLDPCLYKALGAHQAVCDISRYAEYIERNYNSYFVVDDKFHYVLTVNAESISAYKLTRTINSLLETVRDISNSKGLNVNVEDIQFSINVNSPGKFSFVTTAKNAALVMAVAVALFGGRISYDSFDASTNGGFRTLVECVNEFLDQDQEREQKAALFDRYINSLDLQSVENTNNMVDEEDNDDNEGNDEVADRHEE